MSPEELQTLNSKIDKLFGVTSDIATDIAVLKSEFKAHREADEERHDNRSVTCPTAPRVTRLEQRMEALISNVDALAGIQRTDQVELKKLRRWSEDMEKMLAVGEATDDVMSRPLRWLAANAERIGIAIVIAYLITRFGL